MSSHGDDLGRTSATQNGSGSRLYAIGAGHLAWMVSFGWNFICACILSRSVLVLIYHSEVMLCDFRNGMEVVSLLDIIPQNRTSMPTGTPPGRTRPPPGPPRLPSGWRGSPLDVLRGAFEGFLTGSWHDQAPGETRVLPDYAGLVTFYDTSLMSLVEARYGKDRLHLRLEGISALDSETVRAELRTVLTREKDRGSGVDWGSITRIVVERYAGRLEYLRFLLSPNTTSFEDALAQAGVARVQLLVMLAPYITTADIPKQLPPSADLSWVAPIAQRCATTQTTHIPLAILTPQEARIHAAVENTLYEICRRLALVWVEFFDVEASDEAGATEAIEVARGHVKELMDWLDWSVWVRCKPECSLGVRGRPLCAALGLIAFFPILGHSGALLHSIVAVLRRRGSV
jgi:hypothetical protein